MVTIDKRIIYTHDMHRPYSTQKNVFSQSTFVRSLHAPLTQVLFYHIQKTELGHLFSTQLE